MRIIDGWEGIEDGFDFSDAVVNDVPREGDIADGSPKQHEAIGGSAGHAAVKRVVIGCRDAAPNQRF